MSEQHASSQHCPTGALAEIARDLSDPSRLLPALSSGFVIGLLLIVVQLSLATFIFSGPLAQFAPAAAGLTLFGTFVMCVVVALGSGFPSAVCVPEDASAAIMASVAAALASGMAASSADPRAAFVTVGAAMGLSTLATAVFFVVLGRFRLGNLIRYIPFPVVAGFLAGVGWLLVSGGFAIMVGIPLGFAGLPKLVDPQIVFRWLPGVGMAAALLLGMARCRSPFVLPLVLLASLACFGGYLLVSGQNIASAVANGLLLGGMPEGSMLWPVFTPADLALVQWGELVRELPQLLTIPLVSAISFLLISSGMEAAARVDLDLRREFYINALANLVGGAGGSHAGYTALSFSLLGPMTGSNSRLVGVTTGLLAGVATFFGSGVLGLFPKFILGGLILFIGVSTLLDWGVRTRTKVSRLEFAVVWAIICSIAFFGFLEGVGVGLLLASIGFVIKYSRVPVLREDVDAANLSSARQRSVPDRHILRVHAAEVRVLRITGYLFFGSATALSQRVNTHMEAAPGARPRFLVLDFADLDGFDSSAVNCFLRMLQKAGSSEVRLLFTGAPASLLEQMRAADPADVEHALFLPDVDRALEWCEDAILAREQADLEGGENSVAHDRLFDATVDDMLRHLEEGERFEALVEQLGHWLELRTAAPGEAVLRQGESMRGVYLFLSGQAEETRQEEDGQPQRLRTLGPGCVAGQTSLPQGAPAPGAITAQSALRYAYLSVVALRDMEFRSPEAALSFHTLYAGVLEGRLMAGTAQ
ncbi:MAG: cyclic nucleotide-binding domain-containing protein [Desulfovibrio sp.]|jgi:SulP family sulfate permease|nr:cyclic nucleotide-binding domain-containing protein [Desulfovibrio sp.]